MGSFIQKDFSGGLNILDHDATLLDNEYGLAFNVRNKTKSLDPVRDSVEDTFAPSGFKQGIYAFDKYLITFVEGFAYYKNVDDLVWTQIPDVFVDPNVDYIYTQAVPASTFNYVRKLKNNDQISGTSAETNVNVDRISIGNTPAGLIVQDGINQGWIIFADATSQRLNRYDEWTLSNRSYVPIMKQMAYLNGILFGIDLNNQLVRSVSGRPLDFVVNITSTGDKGGDASTTSYASWVGTVNHLSILKSGQLLVGTDKTMFPITLNYDRVIFQEPTFFNLTPFFSGITNQFSFAEVATQDFDRNIYKDYGFIDFDGIRSFNAAFSQGNEGRDSLFSSRLSQVFVNKKQKINETAAIAFGDHTFFSVLTKYGNLLAVYDNTRRKWVCFDRLGIGKIKQFAIADQSDNPTLYAITEEKIYKLYSASGYLRSDVYFRANTTGTSKVEEKLVDIRAVFSGNDVDTVVTASSIIDGVDSKKVNESIEPGSIGIVYPAEYPLLYSRGGRIENIHFNFNLLANTGWKIGARLAWQSAAKLLLLELNTGEQNFTTPQKQQSKSYRI